MAANKKNNIQVDFLGSPGVGKTTLANKVVSLASETEASSNWSTIARVERSAQKELAYGARFSSLARAKIALKAIFSAQHSLQEAIAKISGNDRVSSWGADEFSDFVCVAPDLFSVVLKASSAEHRDLTPQRFDFVEMVEWTKSRLLSQAIADVDYILVDNSRYVRLLSEIYTCDVVSNERFRSCLTQFMNTKLAPNGVVCLVCSPEECLRRIKKRLDESGEIHAEHKNLLDTEIIEYCAARNEVNLRAVDFFLDAQIPTLIIDSVDALSSNAYKTRDFCLSLGEQ